MADKLINAEASQFHRNKFHIFKSLFSHKRDNFVMVFCDTEGLSITKLDEKSCVIS